MCVDGDLVSLVVIEKLNQEKTMEFIVSRMEVLAVDGKRYVRKMFYQSRRFRKRPQT